MNHKYKVFLIAVLMVLIVAFTAGCGKEQTPYQINDGENYSYSVKYDANGGTFTTNTSVIVDCFNLAEVPKNEKGEAEIVLLSPDDSRRGNDAFQAVNKGHFLAGWYTQRIENTDEAGNTTYTYSGRWDFENSTLTADPQKNYSAQEPVMTLYAAWVPLFEIRFIDIETGEQLQGVTFDPAAGNQFEIPVLNEETGAMDMFGFPKRVGYTFAAAYLDQEGTTPLADVVEHPGTVDEETGTAVDSVLNIYTKWQTGEWYHIFRAEQFIENASVSGCYEIHADLDFEGKIWPTALVYGNYTGILKGNGYTIKNVSVEQTNNSKTSAGLFGTLAEDAQLLDVTFENVTFTIKAGTRVAGTSFGLLAGTVSSSALLKNVSVTDSKLLVHGNAYFGTDDYTIGLISGMGQTDLDASGVTAGVVESPDRFVLVDDGYVTFTDVPPETVAPVEETTAPTQAEEAAQ